MSCAFSFTRTHNLSFVSVRNVIFTLLLAQLLPSNAVVGTSHSRPRPQIAASLEGWTRASLHEQVLEQRSHRPEAAFLVTAHGDVNHVMRRAGAKSGVSEQPQDLADAPDLVSHGAVDAVEEVDTESEQTKLEELNEECMASQPTAECMEKFGSYGIRRLHTEDWSGIEKLYTLPLGWMSHPEVQKRRLFDLTLPGTANSGTYEISKDEPGAEPFNVVKQNLNFEQQLKMGVRAFEIRVAFNERQNMTYISNGVLTVPLAVALRDIRTFLEIHQHEVVILDVQKDETAEAGHLAKLNAEELDPKRVPGEIIHETVACELKEMLATYTVLSRLPGGESAENPTISALTELGVQVVYFWHSQQVLCTNFVECERTPGWWPKDNADGFPFAFGPPQPLGQRVNITGGRHTAKIIEPACMSHSLFYTRNPEHNELMTKIKHYAQNLAAETQSSRPKCFPLTAKFPAEHTPTILYTIDGYITPTATEQKTQTYRMHGLKAIYTRGEAYTAKSNAERTNYLLLSWFLKKENQRIFTRPNIILFEFAGSAAVPILRIVEAMQARQDCGFAVYCKTTGSCWADTLLNEQDACTAEDQVLDKLRRHSDIAPSGDSSDSTGWVLYVTVAILFCFCGGGLLSALSKAILIMSDPRRSSKETMDRSLLEDDEENNEVLEHESTLPGSEAASDYDQQETNEQVADTSAEATASTDVSGARTSDRQGTNEQVADTSAEATASTDVTGARTSDRQGTNEEVADTSAEATASTDVAGARTSDRQGTVEQLPETTAEASSPPTEDPSTSTSGQPET